MNKIIWLLLSVMLLASSCMSVQPVTVERIEKITLSGLPLNLSIGFHAVIHNPNSFGVWLQRLNADVAIDGMVIAHVNLKHRKYLAARSNISIPFEARPDMIHTIGLFLSAGSLTNWHTQGSFEIRKLVFRKTIPFSVSGPF